MNLFTFIKAMYFCISQTCLKSRSLSSKIFKYLTYLFRTLIFYEESFKHFRQARSLKLLSTAVHFFTNDSPSKTMKSFLFHLKSSFSWDIQIAVIFSLSFRSSQIQWCHERAGLHELADVIFGINPKPFFIASSN